jgi:hypothetical protein
MDDRTLERDRVAAEAARPLPDIDEEAHFELLTEQAFHEIVPGVFLGGDYAPQRTHSLAAAAADEPGNSPPCSLVVRCGETKSSAPGCGDAANTFAFPPKADATDGRVSVGLHSFDEQDGDLAHLIHALGMLRECVSAGGRALVHCQQGIDRSATVVAAFIMFQLDLPGDVAFGYVRSRRRIADPGVPGYKEFLEREGGRIREAGTRASGAGAEQPLSSPVAPSLPVSLPLPGDSSPAAMAEAADADATRSTGKK